MGHNIIQFPEARAAVERRHQHSENDSLSDRYIESLTQIHDLLKRLAQECDISLKEAVIDLTYLAVGDEIVTKLTDGVEES